MISGQFYPLRYDITMFESTKMDLTPQNMHEWSLMALIMHVEYQK